MLLYNQLKLREALKLESVFEGLSAAFQNGTLASMIGLQSGHAIDSSLAMLRIFYYLGARYMALTHNCNLPWASSNIIDSLANASQYGGLTPFGRKIVREMNRLGMIIDLSLSSRQTQIDALSETRAPVIFSHSAVYKLCNNTQNVQDDVLLKLVNFKLCYYFQI
jgi:membrane dipeptidase